MIAEAGLAALWLAAALALMQLLFAFVPRLAGDSWRVVLDTCWPTWMAVPGSKPRK